MIGGRWGSGKGGGGGEAGFHQSASVLQSYSHDIQMTAHCTLCRQISMQGTCMQRQLGGASMFTLCYALPRFEL